jgi:hypothetical protein
LGSGSKSFCLANIRPRDETPVPPKKNFLKEERKKKIEDSCSSTYHPYVLPRLHVGLPQNKNNHIPKFLLSPFL